MISHNQNHITVKCVCNKREHKENMFLVFGQIKTNRVGQLEFYFLLAQVKKGEDQNSAS